MSSIADIYTIQQEISHLCLLCNRNNWIWHFQSR
jgi:hypothetical protein